MRAASRGCAGIVSPHSCFATICAADEYKRYTRQRAATRHSSSRSPNGMPDAPVKARVMTRSELTMPDQHLITRAEGARETLGEEHRPMLATGAADRDG